MPSTDPRIDAYIAAAAAFARPILERLRSDVHAGCPELGETIKWGMPTFTRGGRILCHMAAFKQHCAFGFRDPVAAGAPAGGNAMGQFGRIGVLADLPPSKTVREQVARAAAAIDAPTTRAAAARAPRAPLAEPDDLRQALDGVAAARGHFEAFSPSQRREYIEWVLEAKRPATRARRIGQAVEWIAAGKARNWKYAAC